MTRADEWARVDYRSRAIAIICAIATTLVATVALTAYVATQVGFADKNMVVVPVVSSFVWIAAACCCALRRRRQQRRLSGKGV